MISNNSSNNHNHNNNNTQTNSSGLSMGNMAWDMAQDMRRLRILATALPLLSIPMPSLQEWACQIGNSLRRSPIREREGEITTPTTTTITTTPNTHRLLIAIVLGLP